MLSRLRVISLASVFLALLTLLPAYAQRFRGLFGMDQNNPPADSEFIFARWQVQNGGGWWHDYPDAEEHITQVMKEATGIHVEHTSYRIVPMSGKELFDYPYGYISEPGMMLLNDVEVKNFREFVDRGGFVMLDDFDGPRQFAIMKQNIERVFPNRPLIPLTSDHHILHNFYDVNMEYVESPYDVGDKAVFYGIYNDKGDLSVVICFNNDIGDFWEWIDRPQYALKPSAEGLKLGINFVLYSMTH
jgi:hypothetical protein